MSNNPPENQDKSAVEKTERKKSSPKEVKKTRLKHALRDNLRRRKHKTDPSAQA